MLLFDMPAPMRRRTLLAAASASLALPAWPAAPADFITGYERSTGGRVGFHAQNLASGTRLAWRGDERFAMCSTFKASLAGFVLARVDAGRESMERQVAFGAADLLSYAPAAKARLDAGSMSIAQLCEGAVVLSDNTCANLLLREVGGPQALTRFWRGIGDRISRLDHDEPALNRARPGSVQDMTSPAAMAATIARLTAGHVLHGASRDRLVQWMVECRTGLRKLRAGLPPDWRVGDKTGNNGADAAGDLAIAWPARGGPVVIAAYVQGGTPTPAQQDALFEEIGRRVAARLAAS